MPGAGRNTSPGVMDLVDVQLEVSDGQGTATVFHVDEELADGAARNFWIENPCVPSGTPEAALFGFAAGGSFVQDPGLEHHAHRPHQ